MGRKGNWLSAMKKVLNNSEPKEENNQESRKSKKKWYKKKKKTTASNTPPPEPPPVITTAPPAQIQQSVVTPNPDPPRPSGAYKEPTKVAPKTSVAARAEPEKRSSEEKEQKEHAYKLPLATAKASGVVSAEVKAAADAACVTADDHLVDESKEEMAVIKLQTAFRGYLARRTLCALRGLKRLQSVMQRQAVTRQTSNTLKCMQTLARMQSQIRERRLRMSEEINLVRQIQQKNAKEQAKELEKSQPRGGNGWDASGKTKAEIEATQRSKHEAAVRRERTLAYAYSHQQTWKTSEKYGTTLFMDNSNPHWGWSWLERWLAARPWENTTTGNSPHNKPTLTTTGDEILKSYARRNNPARSSTSRLSTSLRSPSQKASPRMSVWGVDSDDMASTHSEQSSTSVRDDNGAASPVNVSVPAYMAQTEAAKARARLTPDRSSVSSVRKQGSRPPSPATSRRSSVSGADVNSIM